MEITEIWKTIKNEYIEDWKKQNKKIIGYYCSSVPEEIIHAGSMLPYRIRGTTCEDTALADSILSKLNCSFVRCTLNLAMKGKYDFIDGLANSNQCDHARRMYDIWKIKLLKERPNFYLGFLSVPHLVTEEGEEWFRTELINFKKSLESFFKIKIEEEEILNSIKLYNESRKLLNRLHEYRSLDKPLISAEELTKVVIASLSMPKEKYIELLTEFVNEVSDRPVISDYRARLMLVGSVIDNPGFYEIFKDLKTLIVADTLCFGMRNYCDLVKESSDPFDGLIDYYYKRLLCPRMMDRFETRRLKFVRDQVKKANIQGVIVQRIEFCDLHGCDNMLYQHKLEELDIPVLNIDREYLLGDTARLKTRVEAFIEQIER
ncbi:MAG: 2-hydroxyacyl-CoA dehydratase subunit D [Candidatus Helarchaeota archaeon]